MFGSATVSVTRPSPPTSAPQHSCGYVSCPWSRMASSIAADTVSRASGIDGPEFIGEILFRAVGKNRHNDPALESLCHVEHDRQRGAGGDAAEQPFLAGESPHHLVRPL